MTNQEAIDTINHAYTDSFGLVTTHQLDGGDSSHKCAHYTIACSLLPIIPEPGTPRIPLQQQVMRQILHTKGLIRHPDPEMWYSELNRYSRDQFAPQVILAALTSNKVDLVMFFSKHLKHLLLFTWNTRHNWVYPENHPKYNPNEELKYSEWKLPDITFLEFLGFYIRGFRCHLFYFLLILSDIETVLSAVVKRFDSDNDVNNCLAACILAKKVMPTGLGHIAYWILKPVLKRKLQAYWDHNKYEPPIGDIYINALDL